MNDGGWQAFRRNRGAFAAAVILLLLAGAAAIGPPLLFLYNHCSYETQDLESRLQQPTPRHPLGTDPLGRDILVRLLYSVRVSLSVGLLATLIALIIGVGYGAIAGYFSGWLDEVMMRSLDVIYSLPILILLILILAVFERRLALLIVALGCTSWLTMARIVRGQVLSLRREQFIDAARLGGASPLEIVRRHIVPNTLGPVIVAAALTAPSVVLAEAFLSFLGLGVQPPMPSLGTLVVEGAQVMAIFPILLVGPAVVLAVAMVSLNLIGDGLRDALDPRTRRL